MAGETENAGTAYSVVAAKRIEHERKSYVLCPKLKLMGPLYPGQVEVDGNRLIGDKGAFGNQSQPADPIDRNPGHVSARRAFESHLRRIADIRSCGSTRESAVAALRASVIAGPKIEKQVRSHGPHPAEAVTVLIAVIDEAVGD